MNILYVLDPKAIPAEEVPEWDKYLNCITDSGMPWIPYAVTNNLHLVIVDLYGRLGVHILCNFEDNEHYKPIDTLELLKGLALRKTLE